MTTHYNIVVYNAVASVVNATILRSPNCCGFCICNSIVYKLFVTLLFISFLTLLFLLNCRLPLLAAIIAYLA